jgi:hypothetical protein
MNKSNFMRTTRLLLFLGASIPSVFLAAQTGAKSMASVIHPELPSLQPVANFAPNLSEKLKFLLPNRSVTSMFCESGTGPGGGFLEASGGPGPGCPPRFKESPFNPEQLFQ